MQRDDAPLPRCGHNDVLIRVAASGVNPIDWKIRAGLMAQAMPLSLPPTPGWECAGTCAELVHAHGEAKTLLGHTILNVPKED
jgi:NADPH:quinone reductase-like Zn-dependent oxidoreductase